MTDQASARQELEEWVSRARAKYYLSEAEIEALIEQMLKALRCSGVARL